MGFELTMAAKRAPGERTSSAEPHTAPPVTCTTLALNGALDEAAVASVLSTVADLSATGAESVVVEMENVSVANAEPLRKLSDGLMSLRGSGVHVQVAVAEPSLRAKLSELPDSRDWLLGCPDAIATGARRALHLDGPHG